MTQLSVMPININ